MFWLLTFISKRNTDADQAPAPNAATPLPDRRCFPTAHHNLQKLIRTASRSKTKSSRHLLRNFRYDEACKLHDCYGKNHDSCFGQY